MIQCDSYFDDDGGGSGGAAQTPQQRLANERFAKSEAAKRGKPAPVVKKQEVQKSPVSKGWVVVLAFVVCGGLIFELLRLFF
ncbi:hypothetical protein IWX50DRAFT_660407 [Phyllosticta citricarpa]|uniref:Stress-associated endoplasmic reticulum protein n=1 Tax=Phyllosticta citricarpa TaxID=55181 RepID=A0ABR1MIN4_9PEZI